MISFVTNEHQGQCIQNIIQNVFGKYVYSNSK